MTVPANAIRTLKSQQPKKRLVSHATPGCGFLCGREVPIRTHDAISAIFLGCIEVLVRLQQQILQAKSGAVPGNTDADADLTVMN
ncbi:hypothetical protein AB4144_33900, partial [Rhizobiaceae sp. 2RAB30]